jgi:hypothetical protein
MRRVGMVFEHVILNALIWVPTHQFCHTRWFEYKRFKQEVLGRYQHTFTGMSFLPGFFCLFLLLA